MFKDRPELKRLIKPSDFNSDDKMNVDAGKRLCDQKVIDFVEDPGLKTLLNQMRGFIDAFERNDLTVQEKLLKVININAHEKSTSKEKDYSTFFTCSLILNF